MTSSGTPGNAVILLQSIDRYFNAVFAQQMHQKITEPNNINNKSKIVNSSNHIGVARGTAPGAPPKNPRLAERKKTESNLICF